MAESARPNAVRVCCGGTERDTDERRGRDDRNHANDDQSHGEEVSHCGPHHPTDGPYSVKLRRVRDVSVGQQVEQILRPGQVHGGRDVRARIAVRTQVGDPFPQAPMGLGHARPGLDAGAEAEVEALSGAQQLDAPARASTFASTSRACRAAIEPIETWSSWFALVGIESAEAGWTSDLFSDTSAAAVYWSSIIPLLRPASSARNGGRPESRPSISSAVRRSLIEPSSAIASAAKSIASATGSPWKLPPEITRPPPVATASGSASVPSGKDERVVGAAVDLDLEDAARVPERVADGAVDLRDAADRVGVLDLVRLAMVRVLQPGVAQEVAQLGGDAPLTGVRARGVVGGRERDVGPEQRLDAHRADDRRRAGKRLRGQDRERSDRSHLLRAVEQRQPFLRLEASGSRPTAASASAPRHDRAADFGLAAADQRPAEVRERRQVAGRADGALLGNDRMDAEAQEVEQPLDDLRAGSRSGRGPACWHAAAASPGRFRGRAADPRRPRG